MKPKQKNEMPSTLSLSQEPNAYQIATLAAALMRPQDDLANSHSMKRVTSLAVSLWNASENAVQQWKESKERQSKIRDYEAKIPRVPEWLDKAKEDRQPIKYQRGLEVLFQRFRKLSRDGMMLDFLKHLARSMSNGEKTARDNWRRMKKEGFNPGEFNNIAERLPDWLHVRRSLVNTENAKQTKRRSKKSLEG
jgi:hypothetical protein